MKECCMPDIGNENVEVIEVAVKEEEEIEKEQTIIVIEGQKTSMEIPSTKRGKVKKILVKVGQSIRTNDKILLIEEKEERKEEGKRGEREGKRGYRDDQGEEKKKHASPSIRKMAREKGVELRRIKGTGRKERIIKEDIEMYLKGREDNSTLFFSTSKENILDPKSLGFSELTSHSCYRFTRVELSAINRLEKNWSSIPHVTQFMEVDITSLDAFRKTILEDSSYRSSYSSLTYLPFIIKTISYALKKFSRFNSSYSSSKKALLVKNFINIGIVVDSKEGLFIPVLKSVDKKSILEISHEIQFYSEKLKKGKLELSETQGATFTISSLGGIGGSFFTPIVNSPEVGILGISKALLKPRWLDDKFVPCLMLPLSLSYDHRAVNGVYAVKFLNMVVKLLSNVTSLLVQ